MHSKNQAIKQNLDVVKKRIESSIFTPLAELEATAWITKEPVSFKERFLGEKKIIKVGHSWGTIWECAWFNFKGVVPKEGNGKNIVLLIDISGEACVVDEVGNPIQGLTTVSSEFEKTLGRPGKRVLRLFESASGGEKIDIWADCGCNDLFGKYQDSGILKEAYIAACNPTMEQLYYDFEVLYEMLDYVPDEKASYHSILFTLYEASKLLINYSEEEAEQARDILLKELKKVCGDTSLSISAIGHAHIDLAWLWPIRETIRKGARTFSTALKNMDRFEDYVFGASQPQLYEWVKEYYPALYDKVKKRVEEGRWEAQGAMWVEADTNISGGEALVRQVLYGKRFFRSEFNKDMKVLWLPDVFGYSAALPQILIKSGVDYFMTIKLSWNKINRHPHHTFWWKGLDGTKVLSHMPPEGTYNSSAAPRAILAAEKNFLDKGISDRCLMLFGIGDGGGGPGEEHLERLKREKSLNGLIPVVQEPSLDFFKKIEKDGDKYETWSGELYLECHQGTYTSEARNKRFNRKMEIALRELEIAYSQAIVYTDILYPQSEVEEIWKEVLLYQFHDILPGSSIERVYKESLERYEVLYNKVKELTQKAYLAITESKISEIGEKAPVVCNTLSWDRESWISYNNNWYRVIVKAFSFENLKNSQCSIEGLYFTNSLIENDLYKISFNELGDIESIWDKEFNREVIESGKGANVLCVYNDNGDAWDFPMDYDQFPCEKLKLTDTNTIIEGPKIIRKNKYVYKDSILNQNIVLTRGSRRIDFITDVDWKEEGKMLRTSFPVNVISREATCDIQFGNIKRTTHRNTSWDMAKYEVCAHKWVDISQADYGVALLNDCKYGHKVIDNVIDLNLIRCTNYPDISGDKAYHEFTYALYPHEGDYIKGKVVRAGYELNMPIEVVLGESFNEKFENKPFISVSEDNIIVEAVKKAEDSEDLIIRLYECHGISSTVKISFGFEIEGIELVNLMEEILDSSFFDKNKHLLSFKPFEIHTLKVSFKRG